MKVIKYFVGIDISSEYFTSTIITHPGNIICDPQDFECTPEGFTEFMAWLQRYSVTKKQFVICMESTGVYGEKLCYFLFENGFQLVVEQPLKVKRAFKLSGHKTDSVDSINIAKYTYRFLDELTLWLPRKVVLEKIKVLLTVREQIVRQKTAASNSLHSFKRKEVIAEKAHQILLDNINYFQNQKIAIENEIDQLIEQDADLRGKLNVLISAPGIGKLLALQLLILTNGFMENVNAKKIAAYCGICPYKHQSGTSIRRRTRSRSFGPTTIRKLLYLASCSVINHDRGFKKYYLRKQAEGKHNRIILNNVSNKLIRLICAMMNDHKMFIPNHCSINPLSLNNS